MRPYLRLICIVLLESMVCNANDYVAILFSLSQYKLGQNGLVGISPDLNIMASIICKVGP